jgi:hypothetical protein
MKVQVDLDSNTMEVTEQDNKSSITVNVRLAEGDIRDSAIRSRVTQLWDELAPLREFVGQVVLETTASNVSVIKPIAWMFPLPLTPLLLSTASTRTQTR